MQTGLGSYRHTFHLTLLAAASMPALLVGAAMPVAAADLSYKDDRPAIVAHTPRGYGWAGFYLGGHGGWSNADNGGGAPFIPFFPGAPGGDVAPPAGDGGDGGGAGGIGGFGGDNDTFVGLHAGYNWQRGSMVYGLEADVSANGSLDDLLASFRARIGFATPRTLFYATAGLAYLSEEGADAVLVGGVAGGAGGPGANGGGGGGGGAGIGNAVFGDEETDEFGFVAGGGIEYKLSQSVSLGVEGLYYTFDDLGVGRDSDFFTVRGRLTMHLNGDRGDSLKDGFGSVHSAGWSGFYIGGHAGGIIDASDDAIDDVDFAAGQDGQPGQPGAGGAGGGGGGGGGGGSGAAIASLNDDLGFVGGAHLGYNWQAGSVVYGIEGDASFGDEKFDYLASVRARLGYATGSYLFYGTAGVAFAGVDRFTAIFAGPGGNGGPGLAGGAPGAGGAGGIAGAVSESDDKVGFVVGAGIDAKLTDRMTLGLEGLFYSFEDDDDIVLPAGATAAFVGDDSDAVVIRGRISYQLSHGRDALK